MTTGPHIMGGDYRPSSRRGSLAKVDYLIVQVESLSDEAFRTVRKAIHAAAAGIGEQEASTIIRDAPMKEDRTAWSLHGQAERVFNQAYAAGSK